MHDGYSNAAGKCECTKGADFSFYSGNTCVDIVCTNSGVPLTDEYEDADEIPVTGDQRCSCPPGFLGAHCEPTHCVPGDVKSFDEVSHGRDVSVIITYNAAFQQQVKNKDKNDNLPKTICDTVNNQTGVTDDSIIHFWLMEGDVATNKDTCEDDVKNIIALCELKDGMRDCEGQLTTDYIIGALESMREDSRLIILSNEGIQDEDPTAGMEAIRKKAISLRIQIHSIVLSPIEPNYDSIYFTGEYELLRELSESTLGFFINPFSASGGQMLAKDGITTVLQKMMEVFFEYVVLDRITTSKDSCNAHTDFTVFRTMEEKPSPFWLTVSSNGDKYSSYITTLVGAADSQQTPTVDAGFFKGYTLPAIQGQNVVIYPENKMTNGKCVPTTILVLAKSAHLARFAITNNDAVDASSPYAISGAKNTLVGHFLKDYHEDKLDSLFLEFNNDNFKSDLTKKPLARDCQYNAKFDDVTCDEGTNTLIRVRDRDTGAAVTVQSLYCTEPETSAQSDMKEYQSRPVVAEPGDPPACSPPSIEVVQDERTLILAAHATESIYKLFSGSSQSAIRYLNDLEDTNHYGKYVLNIFNAEDASNAENANDYADFKSKLMSRWNVKYATSKDADCKALDKDGKEKVFDTLMPIEDIVRSTDTNPNSDIIYIIDQAIKTSPHPNSKDPVADTMEDLKSLQKIMYQKRHRLIVLLLGCSSPGEDFANPSALPDWNTIAARTGGFVVHFDTPEKLNEFFASYVDWVRGETAATIDGDGSLTNLFADVITTPFLAQDGNKYTFLVNTVPPVPTTITVTTANGDEAVEKKTLLGNSLSIYEYQAKEDGVITVKSKANPFFTYASIRVIDVPDDDSSVGLATIGFTGATCLDSTYPDLNPKDKNQYPVTDTVAGANVSMTIFTSDGSVLRSDDVNEPVDTSYRLDYNWKCNNKDNQFYVSADVVTETSSYTRVITTQCFGSGNDDEDSCITGHYNADLGHCVCPHDFTGDQCDHPVCQNGGTVNPGLTCDCTDDYAGEFCEIYSKCADHSSFTPQYKSIPTTIIFMFEKSKFVIDRLNALIDPTNPNLFQPLRAAQYLVVEYGPEMNFTLRLSTTDKDVLYSELQLFLKENEKITDDDSEFDALPAIKAALIAQTTASAHLFWFAKDDAIGDFVSEVFEPIAANRVTVSALFGESLTLTPVHPVTLVGGSIFYSNKDDDYKDFFDKYVIALLTFEDTFEHRLNVLSISTACNAKHDINIDKTAAAIFVAADSADSIKLMQGAKEVLGVDIPGGMVFSDPAAGAYTVVIEHADAACVSSDVPVNRTSSVSGLTQNQVAYGFYRSDDSNSFMDSAVMGNNILVTYWLSEGKASAPTAVITPLTTDGAGASTKLYMTVRDDCSYTLSVPVNCNGEADAYGVKITNSIIAKGGKAESLVDKYIPVLCLSSHTCHNGGNVTDNGCDCEPFYGGDFCEIDQCANGERTGDKCVCNTGYTGEFCETFIEPADRAGVAFLFIQDVCGADEGLKDKAQSVFASYMALLTNTNNIYLGTNNPDQADVVPVPTVNALNDALALNRKATATCDPSIGATLDSYYQAIRKPALPALFMSNAAADPSIGSANVAHVTTVGTDANTGEFLGKLSSEYILDMEFVGITDKNVYFAEPNAFDLFPGEFTQSYDTEVALLDLVNNFGSDKKPSIPPVDDRCFKDLQAAIVFHNDISSVPRSTEFRSKAQKILASITNYFTIPDVKSITIDDATCEFNKSQEAEKTLFYGSIYLNSSQIMTPTFCTSNMNSYPNSVVTADYKPVEKVDLQKVIDSYTKWYSNDGKMKCHCFDYQNPETTQIIVWSPLNAVSNDDPSKVSFDGFKMTNFTHIVMPFGFNYKDSPVWNGLVPDKSLWLDDASNPDYAVEDIIQDVWSIICRISGRIQSDWTAEPYNPYTTRKPKSGDGKDDASATIDPIGDNELPR